jgi:ABC-type branched-subunit amino acid transport system ATPase component
VREEELKVAILETENITKHFGGLAANVDISIQIEEGAITSIIGPNGAGKTTLFNILTGLYKPDRGRIHYLGKEITNLPIHQIVKLGIARSFQVMNIFNEISPYENIRLGVQSRRGKGFRFVRSTEKFEDINEDTTRILNDIGLSRVKDIPTKYLSYGDKRILEIGIALASHPRLILMDEPTSGLPSSETDRIKDFIKKLSEDITIVVIEHDMNIVLTLSDVIIVLHQGQVIARGAREEIKSDEKVQQAYLGGMH